MKKLTLILIATALILATVVVGVKTTAAKYDGSFIVEVIDNNNSTSVEVFYNEGDTTLEAIAANEDITIVYVGSDFGNYITAINQLDSTAGDTLYIQIWLNGEESTVGIDDINPEDITIIGFILVDWAA